MVIGYRAPADLRGAVQSLLDQDVRAEIVVVNSGGGDARVRLAGLLDRIVLIEVRSRLFIGAARNIGIDATAAPYVAFLASDCRAGPGWVQARLARHLDGAAMVSSPVLPDQPGNWCSLAANALLHWRRRPGLPATAAVHYGRSYSRAVFRSCGYFAPGLRSMEDTEFNAVADAGFTPVWAPEVLTLHCYPTGLWGFLRDCVGRSIRRVANPPLSDFVAPPAVWRQALSYTRHRHKVALAGFGLRRDIPPARRLGVRALLGLALGLNLAGLVIGYRRLARQGAAERYIQAIPQRPPAPDAPHPQSRARVLIAHQNWRRSFAQVKLLFATQTPGDDARLRDHLTAIVDIAPAETAPVMLLCDVLVRLGCLEQALRAAENALLTRPGNPHFWTKASLLAGQAGQPEQAIFYGQGALARAPANTTAHLALELAYRALQKPYLARRRSVLRKALDGKAG